MRGAQGRTAGGERQMQKTVTVSSCAVPRTRSTASRSSAPSRSPRTTTRVQGGRHGLIVETRPLSKTKRWRVVGNRRAREVAADQEGGPW